MKREPGFYWVRVCERHHIDGDGWATPEVAKLRDCGDWDCAGFDIPLDPADIEVISERLSPPPFPKDGAARETTGGAASKALTTNAYAADAETLANPLRVLMEDE